MQSGRIKGKSFFAFADTHGNHWALQIPKDVDILICAGDAVEDNLNGDEYDDFIAWFAAQPAEWKIFTPGNHELSFELDQADVVEQAMCESGITILRNSVVECDGIMIGSIDSNATITKEDIPKDLDILVTHYPPYGILDDNMGSTEILNFVLQSQPEYHFFGHIHSTAGEELMFGETRCVNVGIDQT
ncbi:MAG: metallophosphoesterase [Rikenellaceae bacterium]|nr:metallophosphoesterase [Rikenellaceae bacterium]